MTALARFMSPITGAMYRARSADFVAAAPRPLDEPRVDVPGPDPLRILLFGAGAANGWGVTSHRLGLAGHLADDLAARTARGVRVDIRAAASLSTMGAIELLGDRGAAGYAVAIYVMSYRDAFHGIGRAAWESQLRRLVQLVQSTGGPGLPFVLVGASPARTVAQFSGPLRWVVSPHLEELNAVAANVADQYRGARYVRLPGRSMHTATHRSESDYRMGTMVISEAVLPLLPRSGPTAEPAPRTVNRAAQD